MNKTILMAATAVLALTAGSAFAASHPGVGVVKVTKGAVHVPATLYSQNSSFGYAIDSQNFTSGNYTAYNNAGADDFVVPGGHKWKVTGVDVTGLYYNGSGPAASEVVTFYKSKGGLPGAIAAKGTASYTLACTDSAGSFSCSIPGPKGKGLKLSGGTGGGKTYWVSVVANCSFVGGCGQWGWAQTNLGGGNPGEWENPGNAFGTGCITWTPTSTCIGIPTNEWAFDLTGSST